MRSRSSVANKPVTEPAPTAQGSTETPAVSKPETPAMETRLSIEQEKLGQSIEQDEKQREGARRRAAADAPKRASELSMGRHARIVDHLFEMEDPHEVYSRVRQGLSFGGRASSMGYGALADALDEAEKNAADAFQLLINTKLAADTLEMDAKVIYAGMRDQALAELMEMKATSKKETGSAGKAIAKDDIESIMATKFHDEFRTLEITRAQTRRTVAALEDLAERARERAKDLRALVGKARDA